MIPKDNHLTKYFEDEMLRRSGQFPERGYTGTGFWYAGYPAYVGGLTTAYAGIGSYSPEHPVQAQPAEGSKIDGAAEEAGATTSGVASGESGTAAASDMGTV